jgi:hypothetical protein
MFPLSTSSYYRDPVDYITKDVPAFLQVWCDKLTRVGLPWYGYEVDYTVVGESLIEVKTRLVSLEGKATSWIPFSAIDTLNRSIRQVDPDISPFSLLPKEEEVIDEERKETVMREFSTKWYWWSQNGPVKNGYPVTKIIDIIDHNTFDFMLDVGFGIHSVERIDVVPKLGDRFLPELTESRQAGRDRVREIFDSVEMIVVYPHKRDSNGRWTSEVKLINDKGEWLDFSDFITETYLKEVKS